MDKPEATFVKGTLLAFLVVVPLGIGAWYAHGQAEEKVREEIRDFGYIQENIEGVKTVIGNSVSDDPKDYFVVTDEGKSLYVTIEGSEGDYSHESTEVTEDMEALNDMMETSIERENAPKKRAPMLIPVPIFMPK